MREYDKDEAQHIAGEICLLLKNEHASNENGNVALISVLFGSLMFDGFNKERALKMLDAMWDTLAPSYEGWKKDNAN